MVSRFADHDSFNMLYNQPALLNQELTRSLLTG
jgi:hypothetical protein